jgi:NitT/TauT family transport system permease protein
MKQTRKKNNSVAQPQKVSGETPTPSRGQLQFISGIKKHKRCVTLCRVLLLLIFLLLWEVSADLGWIDSFFFSSPGRIVKLFISMCSGFEIWIHIGVTLSETLISFIAITVLSLLVAVLLFCFPRISEILEPFLVILNSLPKTALAPLIIVWLGTGTKTIIIAGMSVAIFGSIINMYTGFSQVEEEKIKLIYTLGGIRSDVLFKVIIPSSVPIIISNMKVNIGLSLVGIIIGEFLAARRGLGYLIIYGSQIFQLDLLIMSIIILCIIAILLYQSIHLLEKHVI